MADRAAARAARRQRCLDDEIERRSPRWQEAPFESLGLRETDANRRIMETTMPPLDDFERAASRTRLRTMDPLLQSTRDRLITSRRQQRSSSGLRRRNESYDDTRRLSGDDDDDFEEQTMPELFQIVERLDAAMYTFTRSYQAKAQLEKEAQDRLDKEKAEEYRLMEMDVRNAHTIKMIDMATAYEDAAMKASDVDDKSRKTNWLDAPGQQYSTSLPSQLLSGGGNNVGQPSADPGILDLSTEVGRNLDVTLALMQKRLGSDSMTEPTVATKIDTGKSLPQEASEFKRSMKGTEIDYDQLLADMDAFGGLLTEQIHQTTRSSSAVLGFSTTDPEYRQDVSEEHPRTTTTTRISEGHPTFPRGRYSELAATTQDRLLDTKLDARERLELARRLRAGFPADFTRTEARRSRLG